MRENLITIARLEIAVTLLGVIGAVALPHWSSAQTDAADAGRAVGPVIAPAPRQWLQVRQ